MINRIPGDWLRRKRNAMAPIRETGFGLGPEWLEVCDRRVTIPMRPSVDSLNVAVAAGIFLYHFATTR